MVKSIIEDVIISDLALHDLFFKCFQDHLDKTALVNGNTGESYTFRELEAAIKRFASGLNKLGVRKGDIVCIMAPNSPEYMVALFGVMATGATTALQNPVYTPFEVAHSLKLTRSTWVITTKELYSKLIEGAQQANSKFRGIIILDSNEIRDTTSFATLLDNDGSWYPNVQLDSRKDMAAVLFSSGTTGPPKGVMLSHYNFVSMMTLIATVMKDENIHAPDEQGVMLCFLPTFHAYGLIGVAMLSLIAGHKTIVLPRFRARDALECIQEHKVTMVSLVPPVLVHLASNPLTKKYDLSSVRRFSCGAAPLSADNAVDFANQFGVPNIRQGFGMTETTLCILYSLPVKPIKPGSVGLTLPNTEVEIVDVETGKRLGPNQRGEVVARGPQIMLGYLYNPEATRSAIDEEGWLHTGDIGYYDEEGYFYIVDRIKELIKCNGFQVAPAELESLLLTHPFVDDAAVVGVPDREAGELPKAFVVIKPGTNPTENEIKSFVSDRLSTFKQLKGGVEFIDSIPKSETGKILRRILREKGSQLQAKL